MARLNRKSNGNQRGNVHFGKILYRGPFEEILIFKCERVIYLVHKLSVVYKRFSIITLDFKMKIKQALCEISIIFFSFESIFYGIMEYNVVLFW